jgi:enterobactin synthetase component D
LKTLLSDKSTYLSIPLPLSKTISNELDSLGLLLPEQLKTANLHRQQEFLAGRYCAAKSLMLAGFTGHPLVGFAEDRSPLWPSDWVGSITHARGLAAAAVAKKSDLLGIGIDAEAIINPKIAETVKKRILTGVELLKEDHEWVTLVFSAKETIYKCLRPLCGQYFGFSDAEIISVNEALGIFRFRLTKDIGRGFQQGQEYEGRFERQDKWIHTAMELKSL